MTTVQSEMLFAMHGLQRGLRVLRYPAVEVLTNLEGVVRQIVEVALGRLKNES